MGLFDDHDEPMGDDKPDEPVTGDDVDTGADVTATEDEGIV